MSERSWRWKCSWAPLWLATVSILSMLFAAGSAVASDTPREPDLEMGVRLVKARCVVCHREKSLPDLVDRCTSDHGKTYLDDFLKRHHAPDDEARADIIAYLTCPPELLPLK